MDSIVHGVSNSRTRLSKRSDFIYLHIISFFKKDLILHLHCRWILYQLSHQESLQGWKEGLLPGGVGAVIAENPMESTVKR